MATTANTTTTTLTEEKKAPPPNQNPEESQNGETDTKTSTTTDAAPTMGAGEKRSHGETADGGEKDQTTNNNKEEAKELPAKKAKIAMPPKLSEALMKGEVDKYSLDEPAAEGSNSDYEKIDTAHIIMFGLHPLIREPPLKKLCGDYGTVRSLTVRSAFASRYGHVQFASTEEAQNAYKALNGAKLLQKAVLVQPTRAAPSAPAPAVGAN